jgi:hypothetical protein
MSPAPLPGGWLPDRQEQQESRREGEHRQQARWPTIDPGDKNGAKRGNAHQRACADEPVMANPIHPVAVTSMRHEGVATSTSYAL